MPAEEPEKKKTVFRWSPNFLGMFPLEEVEPSVHTHIERRSVERLCPGGLAETLLRGRLSTGTAILLVTHDPEQASRMASRHLEVRDGQLVEETP